MAEAPVNELEAAPSKSVPVTETPEFKEALAREREQHRMNLEAEYARKKQELDAQHAPQPVQGEDFFRTWESKYGVSADAGRELAQGIIGHVASQVLPQVLTPLHQSSKRQELRSQRTEVRGNPKLAKLDDKYGAEAMKMLEGLAPAQIAPDSYARALHMVIGQHFEELSEERPADTKQREPAPGPEPLPSSGSAKASKVVLNAHQQTFCDDKGFSPEDFVGLMRDRARKMESQGMTKPQIRGRLGDLLGSIEF